MKQRLSHILMLLCLIIGSVLCPRVAFSHEFAPGHIERSIDVVIRDRSVQIKYAIGLSDITMLDWLLRENEIEPASEQRFRRLIEDYESRSSSSGETDAAFRVSGNRSRTGPVSARACGTFQRKTVREDFGES